MVPVHDGEKSTRFEYAKGLLEQLFGMFRMQKIEKHDVVGK